MSDEISLRPQEMFTQLFDNLDEGAVKEIEKCRELEDIAVYSHYILAERPTKDRIRFSLRPDRLGFIYDSFATIPNDTNIYTVLRSFGITNRQLLFNYLCL